MVALVNQDWNQSNLRLLQRIGSRLPTSVSWHRTMCHQATTRRGHTAEPELENRTRQRMFRLRRISLSQGRDQAARSPTVPAPGTAPESMRPPTHSS